MASHYGPKGWQDHDAAYERGCQGKVRFTNGGLAAKAAGRKGRRAIYRCKFCGGWHVGGKVKGSLGNKRPVPRRVRFF